MRTFLYAISISGIAFLNPNSAQSFTGNDLSDRCGGSDESFCVGFVIGAISSYGMTKEIVVKQTKNLGLIDQYEAETIGEFIDLFCLPQQSTIGQYVQVVRQFMRSNPSYLHNNASLVVLNAMKGAFPCR